MSTYSRTSNQSKQSKTTTCTCKLHPSTNTLQDDTALDMVMISAPEGHLDQTANEYVAAQTLWRDLKPPAEDELGQIEDPVTAEEVEFIRATMNNTKNDFNNTQCERRM